MLKVRKMRGYVNSIIILGLLAFASLYFFAGVSFVVMLNVYVWVLCTLFNCMMVKASRLRGLKGFIWFFIRYFNIYSSIVIVIISFSAVYLILG